MAHNSCGYENMFKDAFPERQEPFKHLIIIY